VAWSPRIPGITEVLHAQIVDYAYPSHSHDAWALLIVDRGAIRYDLDKHECGAEAKTVVILPPGIVHNGRPAPGSFGFQKRVVYLDHTFLPARLVGAAVDNTNLQDPGLHAALGGLHESMLIGDDPLNAESQLAMIAARVTAHLDRRLPKKSACEGGVAHRLRELLDENVAQPPSLAESARLLDRSKSHLVRSFSQTFGVSPHAYVIGRRVDAARAMLLAGVSPVSIAASVGFYDQAHLTRHFKRHTSVPPAMYASSHA